MNLYSSKMQSRISHQEEASGAKGLSESQSGKLLTAVVVSSKPLSKELSLHSGVTNPPQTASIESRVLPENMIKIGPGMRN